MEEKKSVKNDGRIFRRTSPMPALEVIWCYPDYVQEQVHRETLWQTALFTVVGEDFKVRAFIRDFLRIFRNFVEAEKMAF
jgi:hypothetical protein